jgi:hypothetical protein
MSYVAWLCQCGNGTSATPINEIAFSASQFIQVGFRSMVCLARVRAELAMFCAITLADPAPRCIRIRVPPDCPAWSRERRTVHRSDRTLQPADHGQNEDQCVSLSRQNQESEPKKHHRDNNAAGLSVGPNWSLPGQRDCDKGRRRSECGAEASDIMK